MKDETTINSYELTLTPNYVSDWNFNDALRELIQNGTDQEVLETNVKTGAPAEENASSLHRVRTQNRK